MPTARMHDDEVDTDAELVRRLLTSQFPHWAGLPIERVPSAGTDNAMYRLGTDLAVRLPRIHWAVEFVIKEQAWLPTLAPHLPLPVPLPVAAGQPEAVFPYPWGVVQWLPGSEVAPDELTDPVGTARELATFVRRLRAIDPTDGPTHPRGRPIRLRDEDLRGGIARLDGEFDADGVAETWSRAVSADDHCGPPVWFHGDLSYFNLLANDGRLAAVLDWGTCGVGDPAIDMLVAWNLFPPDARAAYREVLEVDDAEWERGKGWALVSLLGYLHYHETNPRLAASCARSVEAVLADAASTP